MSEQEKRQGASIVSFGSYRLYVGNAQLWRGVQEVKLTGKAFAVLQYFVGHPGQLATKDDLFTAAWPETVVSESTLVSCIQELRQALRDDAKKPRYIETVHRRGYRFVAAVAAPVSSSKPVLSLVEGFQVPSHEEESQKPVLSPSTSLRTNSVEGGNGENTEPAEGSRLEASEPPLPSPSSLKPVAYSLPQDSAPNVQHSPSSRFTRNFVLAAVLLMAVTALTIQYFSLPTSSTQPLTPNTQSALPLPDKPSIIVLPFVNLSGDPGQDYFSDGLTEVLTGDLSKISSLFVIARNSAFTYKGKAVKVQEVSKEMGVKYVVEGSLQKADQWVRIAVQLIDATTGYHLWSEQYDRPLKNIFALQDEIVQKIVTTLKLQLALQEQGFKVRKSTDSLEAYDAYLRGMEYFWRTTKEANAQARQLFEKAIELDSHYAEACVWLGWTYWRELAWGLSQDSQTLERAFALAQRALALDNSLPTAHSLLGGIYAQKQQYEQARAEGERAIALDPNYADSYAEQAEVLLFAVRPAEALRMMEQAMRLNPRYPFWYSIESGWVYCMTGRYAEAIARLQEAISRNPNFPPAHQLLAASYLLQWGSQQSPAAQTLEPAEAAIQQALALNDSFFVYHAIMGSIYLYQQQYEHALIEEERAMALAPTEATTHAVLAEVLSDVGRTKEALESAAQALRLKPNSADQHLASVGTAYAIAGHYEEALSPLQRYLSRYPNFLPAHLTLAAVYSELGQEAEARAEAAEVLRLNPNFSLELHKQRMPIKDPAVVERQIAALRKAGLK